jgi:hypothetical protein
MSCHCRLSCHAKQRRRHCWQAHQAARTPSGCSRHSYRRRLRYLPQQQQQRQHGGLLRQPEPCRLAAISVGLSCPRTTTLGGPTDAAAAAAAAVAARLSTCGCRRRAGATSWPEQQARCAALPLAQQQQVCLVQCVLLRQGQHSRCFRLVESKAVSSLGAHSKSACTHDMHFNAGPKVPDLMLHRHVMCCFRTSRSEVPGVGRGWRLAGGWRSSAAATLPPGA